MQLYTYFRSSAAYRVRIALNLKGLTTEMIPIHLQKQGGMNKKPEYRAVNPQMRLPALKLDSGDVLIQSLAIIEYLDEVHPQPPLLPADQLGRAGATGDIGARLATHLTAEGFDALEALIEPAPYAFGNTVTLADLCLVPQVYNARRLKVPLERFPKVVAVDAACAKLAAFEQARPENQLDAE